MKYYNVKGKSVTGGTSNITEIIAPTDQYRLSSFVMCNVHASNDATVTLFIQNDPSSGVTNTYNIIKEIAIPAKSSLLLDNPGMLRVPTNYGLYIEVGASDTVDVTTS